MAPTPPRAQGTTAPTARNFDCTATPTSPLAGSHPTMENVLTHGRSDETAMRVGLIGSSSAARPTGRGCRASASYRADELSRRVRHTQVDEPAGGGVCAIMRSNDWLARIEMGPGPLTAPPPTDEIAV